MDQRALADHLVNDDVVYGATQIFDALSDFTRFQILGALSLGDIVLVNEWLPANGRAELGVYLRNRKLLAAPCSLAEQTVQVLESPHFISDTAMDEKKSIEVLLTFDLEERTIQMSDLESLSEGYTFSLSSPANAPVTIRANGKPIATGRLVDINGKLGVEIVESL